MYPVARTRHECCPWQTTAHEAQHKISSTSIPRPVRVPGGTWPTCAMLQGRSGVGSYSRQALMTEMLMTDTVSGPRALRNSRRLQHMGKKREAGQGGSGGRQGGSWSRDTVGK